MIVIAILAILSAIVIFALNPARLFDNFRDSKRVTDITSINKAIVFMESWNQSGITYGTSTYVYISLPDSSSTCSSYTLPTLPTGYTYYCTTSTSYRNTDGTGWIPIDFTVSDSNKYLSSLPVDPVNNTTYFYTYFPGGSYELTAILANPNKNSINDEGSLTSNSELGSPNRTFTTPLQRDKNLIAYWKFDEESGAAYDSSGNGYNGTLSGPERQTIVGTNKDMYYDASSTDHITTSSFAIPDTGVLTIEAWMKSVFNSGMSQTIVGDNGLSNTVGWIYMNRYINTNYLRYRYATGAGVTEASFNNFFLDLDNQWIHIVLICDYANKTAKAYRNGIQFGTTVNLTGTPAFPSVDRVKYVGSYNISNYKITDGSLDEVRIYNRELSADEISAQYNNTKYRYGL